MSSIAVTKIIPISIEFQKHELDFDALLSSLDISPEIMSSPDNTISGEQFYQLLQEAINITGDCYFGLHSGETFSGLSNILGYLLLNCNNLGEAIDKYCSYQSVFDNSTQVTLILEDDYVVIQTEMNNHEHDKNRHAVDLRLAVIYKYCEVLTGDIKPLKAVSFRYEKPESIAEYQRVFNCELHFGRSRNALVFDKSILQTPILQPNNDLKVLFEQYTRQVIDKIPNVDSYSQKVKKLIVSLINGAVPNIEAISENLKIGTRNLQLKLQDEGVTYSKLLDEVRRDLAMEYLKDEDLSIAEVSYMLGFSEPSVFHRSFKRWTNFTPRNFRNSSMASH